MNWYYAVGKEKQGPFDENKFKTLVDSGTITDSTLVWNKTMTGWTAFGAINTKTNFSPTKPDPAPAPATASDTSHQDKPNIIQKICSECGKQYGEDELVAYQDFLVCANCKPAFLQKIREGVFVGEMVYAGFWIRFLAKMIDGLLIGAVNYGIGIGFGMLTTPAAMDDPGNFKAAMLPAIMMGLLQWAINITYSTFFIGKYAATLGKMACGLQVVTAENNKVSYLRAFGRFFSEFISGVILFAGYIMAAFDSEKRTLHDRICSTRVIKKR